MDDFAYLEEPRDAGRRLDAGGFILADPFDTVLRELSEEYLNAAWQRVEAVLEGYQLQPADLSWGWLHSGETYASGFPPPAPSDYTGWTSRHLARFDQDERYGDVDAALRDGNPAIACACTWRSLKWRIAPADSSLGLELIEALWTDECSDWAPDWILRQASYASRVPPHADGPWIEVARAMCDVDQEQVNIALAVARRQYSPTGYSVMLRGFKAFVEKCEPRLTITLPDANT